MTSDLPTPPQTGHGPSLSLNGLPPIYILPTHLTVDELHQLEDQVMDLGAAFTYDAKEAKLFLAKVERKTRAAFDLRARGVWTEENVKKVEPVARKRRRLTNSPPIEVITISDTESERGENGHGEAAALPKAVSDQPSIAEDDFRLPDLQNCVLVVKLNWLHESLHRHRLLPIEPFVVYDARPIQKPDGEQTPDTSPSSIGQNLDRSATTATPAPASSPLHPENLHTHILARAKGDAETTEKGHPVAFQRRRRFNQQSLAPVYNSTTPKLKRMTTSEFEASDENSLPEPPDWVKNRRIYCCLRSTPLIPPNERFISELFKIKESRTLTLDQIGVRAYSTSIASLSAYPYLLQSPLEVIRLPGCDERIASHFSEYQSSAEEESERYLLTARKLDQDENLQCLKIFYNIWGCGADTAGKMYFIHGWKDIDDVVQFGWDTLTRAQQIGVKYYDEFKVPIPRKEVEKIADITKQYARKARGVQRGQWDTDGDMVAIIVGGYRRGKEHCGDVDVILSHRSEDMTDNLVVNVVSQLEESGYITHTLTLNTSTTKRGQQTLPYAFGHGGHGFDSLDKALCVWQDPNFNAEAHHGKEGATPTKVKNPNIHRRVDIIIAPWRTIGCAVLGWSGAMTFERDIRRWCKRERGWKFDSSGVRDRATGLVLDLEAPREGHDDGATADTWEERERRLMINLGIGWRPATERNTG